VSPADLSVAIREAPRVEALAPLAASMRETARALHEAGTDVSELTSFISTTNDLLSTRIIDLVMPPDLPAGIECCWIVMGSEGRYEQTLHTDQDNAIIFSDAADRPPEEVRAFLAEPARRVNEAMSLCGIPLCRGGIMAGNAQWCLSLAEWKEQFARWLDRGGPQALLNATVFFDFRALHGATRLAHELRAWLSERAKGHTRFLLQLTQSALGNRPPLGFFGGFVLATHGGVPRVLDLKVNAITPFVDAARIYSLATGVRETNTVRRLREASQPARISAAQLDAWVAAFLAMQRLRVRLHMEALAASEAPRNLVDPRSLPVSDRRALKAALREAQRLQERLARDYASLGGYGV
jgi:CBS domain-containing protein